jgi:hypothetical protein
LLRSLSGRLLAQQLGDGCARLGPAEAPEGTSGGMPLGIQVHGSRDCRDETRTLNNTRSDDEHYRLARRRIANHGKRWNRCEKPAPSGFGSELRCVSNPRIRYRFDQRGTVKAGRRQGLLPARGAGRAVLGRCGAFGKQVKLPGGHAVSL